MANFSEKSPQITFSVSKILPALSFRVALAGLGGRLGTYKISVSTDLAKVKIAISVAG
jgi:hypothetical protein